MNSVLPTCDAATITMLVTLGSRNADIGSTRYGVLEVRQGPASAAFSGDRRRCFSAHSDTVKLSGGAKFFMAGAMAAFSLLFADLVLFKILALSVADALFVGVRVVFISCQLPQNVLHLAAYPL